VFLALVLLFFLHSIVIQVSSCIVLLFKYLLAQPFVVAARVGVVVSFLDVNLVLSFNIFYYYYYYCFV
jgi:hypothetical protein